MKYFLMPSPTILIDEPTAFGTEAIEPTKPVKALTNDDNLIVRETKTAPKPTTKIFPTESEMLETKVLIPSPTDSVIVDNPPNFSVKLSINDVTPSDFLTVSLKVLTVSAPVLRFCADTPNSSSVSFALLNFSINVSTLPHASSQRLINVSRASLTPSRRESILLVSPSSIDPINCPKKSLAFSIIGDNLSPI